ncbi:transmembrane protein 132B-like [Antedon mediterranea]|uniref:transmembrane protein 132B-like n=1 Tax=Antedon mediterranea TaxID=105859 RepID=UPI003AF69EE8
MSHNTVVCDLVLLLISGLVGIAASSNRPSSIRPQSTYLSADLNANTNSSFFVQTRKHNSEEILLRENITYSGHGLFVDKLVWDVQSHGGAVSASYGPFHVFESDSLIFNSSELYNLKIQTHIITKHIQAYSPSLNILFHLDHKQLKVLNDLSICIDLHILYAEGAIVSSCMLNKSTGSCFLDVPIPMEWWLGIADASYQNSKMQLSYSVSKTVTGECTRKDNSLKGRGMTTTQKGEESKQAPSVYVHVGEVPLQPFGGHYSRIDDKSRVIIKAPDNKDVSPTHGFLFPVGIPQDLEAESFSIKIKPRKGLAITAIHYYDAVIPWQHSNSSDEESTTITYTLTSAESLEEFNALPPREVPIFLVEFKVMNESSNSRHISWKVDIMQDGVTESTKLSAKVSLSRVNVLALIPIAEKTELVNTAVLNNEKVRAKLKVFAISQDHSVVDVTNQSACTSADKNILKVEQNCSYMFFDGSEDSSRSDISITVNYQGKSVDLSLWVWIPELPLIIELSDQKLSLIKEWKVPHRGLRRNRRSTDSNKCKLRYQQATVAVYTRFYTKHANSGRKVHMFGKDTKEEVTSLLAPTQFTTSDPKIATIDNLIVYGHSDGVASVQVMPGEGNKALAHKEFTVGGDKVSVTDLHISMVTGLRIHSVRDVNVKLLKAVRVEANDQLIAKYQEGILDVTLGFSDGAILPLRHVSTEDYFIKALSHDSNIVIDRSDDIQAAVVAIAEGATTIDVELKLPRICHKKHKSTNKILSRIYPVNVSFATENIQQKLRKIGKEDETSGNKAAPGAATGEASQSGKVDFGIVHANFDPSLYENDLEEKSSDKGSNKNKNVYSIPLDEINFDPVNDPNKNSPNRDRDSDLTNDILNNIENNKNKSSAMEIGMYVMLAVFALAITVFLLNCMVYMYRIGRRKKVPPSVIGNYATPNESWSWLGREMESDAMKRQGDCDCEQEQTDMALTQVYTESEVSVEHHSTSCSESPADSGTHDLSETNLDVEEEINVTDEPPSVDEGGTEDSPEEAEKNIDPVEESPMLNKDIQVTTVNPNAENEEAVEYDQLLAHLNSLQAEIQA